MAGTPPIWDADLKMFIFNDGQGNWHNSAGAAVSAPPGRMPFGHSGRHLPGGVDDLGLAPVALSGDYNDLTNQPSVAGPTGPTGATGLQGEVGATGVTGVGSVGSTGPIGISGATGLVGATGFTGVVGATGPTGPVGVTGVVGSTGVSGPAGVTGASGAAGQSISIVGSVATSASLPGSGTVGQGYITTNTGHLWIWNGAAWQDVGNITGPAGATGPQGSTGATGPTGASGGAGVTGPIGVTGPTGVVGSTGVIGVSGLAGATGATGVSGVGGAVGATGPTGLTGASGSTGATGPDSPAGTATVDFRSSPSTTAVVTVSGQAAIKTTSQIALWFMASSSANNNPIQHQMAAAMITLIGGAIVAGTGFTIYATSTGGLATGQFVVQWAWR